MARTRARNPKAATAPVAQASTDRRVYPPAMKRAWLATVLAATAAARAGDDAARAGVEAVLSLMTRAALAGDRDGWMAHVAADDAYFAQEQAHWADDLVKHPPREFVLAIDERERAGEFGPQRAAFTLRMRYRAEIGHATGGKEASWPAVFAMRDPDGEGPEPDRWLYLGEDWLVREGENFTVKFFAGEEVVVREVLAAFPEAWAHVDEGFEHRITRRQEIKLYTSMEHLKATVYLTMPDEVLGGWQEPGESIKFMASYTKGVESWKRAFAHEYGHVATFEMGPEATKMPWWACEGVAELAAERFDRQGRDGPERWVRRWGREGKLAAWDDISDYRTTRADLKWQAYVQGHHMVGYLSDRWGRAKRNEWLRAMAAGKTVDEATREALGLPFDRLDAEWRASLGLEAVASPPAGETAPARGGK